MKNKGFHSSHLDDKELKAQIVESTDNGKKKPIYSAIVFVRFYTKRFDRVEKLNIVYKQTYHSIQEDIHLINKLSKRFKIKRSESVEILYIEPIKYLGLEGYTEDIIGEPIEFEEVAIVKRQDFPCDDCPEGNKTEDLNDQFNSKICPVCLAVIQYERIDGGRKAEIKRVVNKKKNELEIDFDTPAKQNGDKATITAPKAVKQPKRKGLEINKTYNEKCEATMAKMKDDFVDYVFTSPPYNIGKAIGGKKYQGKNYQDELSQQQYFDWQVEVIEELLRVTKNHVFYNTQLLTDNKVSIFLLQEHFKYRLKDIFIWHKRKAAPASTKGVTNSKWEYIFAFSNQDPLMRNFKDGNFHGDFNNIIDVKHDANKYAKKHKAVYPVDLPRLFMIKFGKEGDVWYDPFGGSGTTAVAALREKKNWILSELSKDYCDNIIEPRIKQESSGTIKMDL